MANLATLTVAVYKHVPDYSV